MIYYMLFIRYRGLIRKNRQFKGAHNGERCFIIGNGPSLSKSDLNTIQNHAEHSFSANKIYKFYPETDWRADYYAVSDRRFYAENKKDVDSLEAKKFFPLDFYVENKEQMKEDNIFFRIPFQFIESWVKCTPNLAERLTEGGTITYFLIQIAFYMGFKEIYLIGMDFTYSFGIGPDGKYFEKEGISNHFKGDDSKMLVMPNMQYNLRAYRSARKYAESHGIKIYNATRGGALEVFERVDFDKLFEK